MTIDMNGEGLSCFCSVMTSIAENVEIKKDSGNVTMRKLRQLKNSSMDNYVVKLVNGQSEIFNRKIVVSTSFDILRN